jgi:hypothetical protein
MANFEIVALDPTTPQLRAPGAADAYTLPRPINGRNINYTIESINSTTFTLDTTRNGRVIIYTGSAVTATIPSAIGFDVGFNVWIINNTTSSTGVLTLSSASTIDGQATFLLNRGDGVQLVATVAGGWEIVGGRKPRGYAENINSSTTRASASGDRAIAIGAIASASGLYSIAHGYLASAGNTASIAIGYNANSSGTYSCAILGVSNASYQTAIGYNSGGFASTAVSNAGAVSIGGSYASGSDAFAVVNGSTSGSYGAKSTSALALGYLANVTATNGLAIGSQAVASGFYATAIGPTATASGSGAFAFGSTWNLGYGAVASGNDAFAFGDGSRARESKKYAFAGWALGSGLQHFGIIVLSRGTTDATATALTSDASAASSFNQLILQPASAYAFTGTIVARQQNTAGTASAAWKIEGLIRRDSTAASTTLVASTVTAISNVPGWTVALSADTTNGGLTVTVTGAAATNIRWVGNIQSSEVIYV